MPTTKQPVSPARLQLLSQISQLAQAAIYGSLSETFRRCGNPDCRCQHAEAQIRQGVEAWSQLQDRLRQLAALNKERLIPAKAKK
jgi:hypothetical protein